MPTKLEYLKLAITNLSPIEDLNWYLYAFGLPISLTTSIGDLKPLHLYLKPDGMYYITKNEANETIENKITDYTLKQTLFKPNTPITIDATWLSSVKEPTETTVGSLILNAIGFHAVFKDRLPYFNKPTDMGGLEAVLTSRIVSDEEFKDPSTQIKVSEYLSCLDRIWFLEKLSSLIVIASSPKLITKAPGTDQLRHKLLAENKGKLNDAVVVASITTELDKHDKEYLKGDAASEVVLGKKGNTARKKLYQIYGEANSFDNNLGSTPITNNMSEGLSVNEEDFPKYVNDLRFASYSRGNSTKLSGYSYKILQRSLAGIDITDTDCGATTGLSKIRTNTNKLINRYAKVGGKWLYIADSKMASQFQDKELEVRSSMFCKSNGNLICYKCLGEVYKGNAKATNNLAAGFSDELQTLFLKRMHTSGFELTTLKTKDLFS